MSARSARLCTADGSATFARILTLQAAGWPMCVLGTTMRSSGGLRKTTPAASTASIVLPGRVDLANLLAGVHQVWARVQAARQADRQTDGQFGRKTHNAARSRA
eukprot:scaffold65225_cov66-Phaeocystis_antarctica.AAC.2